MARIIDLALEASEVLRGYSAVHDELLGASMRRWASVAGLRKPIDYDGLEQRLTDLELKLADIRRELAGLPAGELTKRARDDLRITLDTYARALAGAIDKLRIICRKLGDAERPGAERVAYDTEQLNLDKVNYDHAMQEYKRQGIRLNRLLSTY